MSEAVKGIVAGYLIALADEQMSLSEAIKETGICYRTLLRYEREFNVRFARLRPGRQNNPEIKARCIALRGKMSARDIGRELGITRNAVIGHWFRARQQGLIT